MVQYRLTILEKLKQRSVRKYVPSIVHFYTYSVDQLTFFQKYPLLIALSFEAMSPHTKYDILLMCNNTSIIVCHVFNGFSVMVTGTVFCIQLVTE